MRETYYRKTITYNNFSKQNEQTDYKNKKNYSDLCFKRILIQNFIVFLFTCR